MDNNHASKFPPGGRARLPEAHDQSAYGFSSSGHFAELSRFDLGVEFLGDSKDHTANILLKRPANAEPNYNSRSDQDKCHQSIYFLTRLYVYLGLSP